MSLHTYRNSWLNVSVGQPPPLGIGNQYGPQQSPGSRPTGFGPTTFGIAPGTAAPQPAPPGYDRLNELRAVANEAGQRADAAYQSVMATHQGHADALDKNANAANSWSMAGAEASKVGSHKAVDEANNALAHLATQRSAIEADRQLAAPVPTPGAGGGLLLLLAGAAFVAWRFWLR